MMYYIKKEQLLSLTFIAGIVHTSIKSIDSILSNKIKVHWKIKDVVPFEC
jgi:hypothetical protein